MNSPEDEKNSDQASSRPQEKTRSEDQEMEDTGSTGETSNEPEDTAVDGKHSAGPGHESDGSAEEDGAEDDAGEEDQVPLIIHYIAIGVLTLALVILVFAFINSRNFFGSSVGNLPYWQKEANKIIRIATEQKVQKIPFLIRKLSAEEKVVRQNSIWALHYLTGLPWGEKTEECLQWWEENGERVMAGESPPDPPGPDRFRQVASPDELNMNVFLNLKSSRRLVLGERKETVQYEIGLVNLNENSSIQLYPPSTLPYRAYKFHPGVNRKVPVHLRYSPSTMALTLVWLDPENPDGDPIQEELLEYRVFGNRNPVVKPNQGRGTRNFVPLGRYSDVLPGPHSILKLRLEPRGFLVKYRGADYRLEYNPKEYVIQICRKYPNEVPGMSDAKLKRIKREAREHGYRLSRAERMYVTGYTWNTNTDGTGTRGTYATATGKPATTGDNSPSDPRTYASHWKDVAGKTLIYDSRHGWGKVEDKCGACERAYENQRPLSRIDAFLGKFDSDAKAKRVENKNTGRRWILVFEEKE